MLTKKELLQLDKIFKKTYRSLFIDLRKDLKDLRKKETSENIKFLKEIRDEFREISFLVKKFSRKQRILEKKMRAIEDYFDHERN